jgi:hypothetical protein
MRGILQGDTASAVVTNRDAVSVIIQPQDSFERIGSPTNIKIAGK